MIKNQKDFWAGVLFAVFGVAAVVIARENPMGTLSRMGSAYFPTILGVMLAVLGAGISVTALLRRPASGSGRIAPVEWGVLLFILAGPSVFALTLLKAGLLVSTFLMVTLSSFARPGTGRLEVLVLSAVVSGLIWLLFVYGIGLRVPVLPVASAFGF